MSCLQKSLRVTIQGIPERTKIEAGVDLCGAEIGMVEHRLHDLEVFPVHRHPRGRRPTQIPDLNIRATRFPSNLPPPILHRRP